MVGDNSVMHGSLRDSAAAKSVQAKWINGLATEAGWAKGGLKEFEMQLHFEVDDEEVGRAAMSGIAPAHDDD